MVASNRFLYLHESARLGSMRAAADSLGIEASSISRQISQLEKDLGLELFEKKRRSIRLTEAGELAVKHYREGCAASEAFISEIEEIRGVRKGTVTIAMGEGFVGEAFFSAVTEFFGENQDIKLIINVAASTNDILQAVLDDDAHIGMTFETPADPRISVRMSFSQPIMAILSPSHPLAKKSVLSLEDLQQTNVALPRRQLLTRQLLDEVMSKEGVWLRPMLTSNSLLLLKKFAISGRGVTVLPPLAASGETGEKTLVARRINTAELNATSANIVTRHGRRLPVSARRVLDHLAIITKNPS